MAKVHGARVLLVESEKDRSGLAAHLLRSGCDVVRTRGPAEALRSLEERVPDAVILSVGPGAEGVLAAVERLRAACPGAALLIQVPVAAAGLGRRALRQGADDYLLSPTDRQELALRLSRLLERRDLDDRLATLQGELSRGEAKTLIGRAPAMRRVVDRILRVAPLRTTVLICGESGVGKELVARSIHLNSPRRHRPFVALNCAAMPGNLIESELFGHERGSFTGAHTRARGKFELADGGTLFLDEIGEMAPPTQAKLLRVLEEREFMRVGGDRSIRVDVRVLAATNADLEALVASGRFRRDLYYRLKVFTIHVPPLRERRSDIPELVETLLDELARANAVPRKRVTPDALRALEAYSWPGNVRELKNALESLLVSLPGPEIRLEDLPPPIRGAGAGTGVPEFEPGATLAQVEREWIRRTLQFTGGNRTHAAELLGIGVRTLQRKIRLYGLDIPSRRRRRAASLS